MAEVLAIFRRHSMSDNERSLFATDYLLTASHTVGAVTAGEGTLCRRNMQNSISANTYCNALSIKKGFHNPIATLKKRLKTGFQLREVQGFSSKTPRRFAQDNTATYL
jgi:hypothetical protein